MKELDLREEQIVAVNTMGDDPYLSNLFPVVVAARVNKELGIRAEPQFIDNVEGGIKVAGQKVIITKSFVAVPKEQTPNDYSDDYFVVEKPAIKIIKPESATPMENVVAKVVSDLTSAIGKEITAKEKLNKGLGIPKALKRYISSVPDVEPSPTTPFRVFFGNLNVKKIGTSAAP